MNERRRDTSATILAAALKVKINIFKKPREKIAMSVAASAASSFKAATPAFPVRDLERSVAFYGDNLGFSVVASDAGFALLARDAITLLLWVAGDLSWQTREETKPIVSGAESFLAGTASCRISVTDIRAIHQTCDDAGIVHPNGPLNKADYGAMEFAVLDRDGNQITFFEME